MLLDTHWKYVGLPDPTQLGINNPVAMFSAVIAFKQEYLNLPLVLKHYHLAVVYIQWIIENLSCCNAMQKTVEQLKY